MKTCKTGCGKMKAGGSVKKVKKMATGGQALNKAKGFAPAQKGGDNVSKNIFGVPNAGPTGPNRTGTYDYKKGGSVKKYQDGGPTIPGLVKKDRREIMRTPSGKIGVIGSLVGSGAIGAKMIADKVKSKKAEKKEAAEKAKATPKAKFGSSVNVQRGYPGKIRSAGDQGYTAIGKREPSRTKFQKGGSNDNIGGPTDLKTPGTMIMRADKVARSKYYTPDNIRKEGIKLSDKDIEKKVKVATDSLYKKYMKDAKLTPEKKSTTKKSTTKKMAKGGFPDLTGDNKVTKADILKGRGVIKKKGGSVKK